MGHRRARAHARHQRHRQPHRKTAADWDDRRLTRPGNRMWPFWEGEAPAEPPLLTTPRPARQEPRPPDRSPRALLYPSTFPSTNDRISSKNTSVVIATKT